MVSGGLGDRIGGAIAAVLGLVAVGIAIFVAAIQFAAVSIAEDAVWNAAGETLGAAGQSGLQAAWGVFGTILTIVAVAGFVLWAVGKVKDS